MPYKLELKTKDNKSIHYEIQQLQELKTILEQYKYQITEVNLRKIKVKENK